MAKKSPKAAPKAGRTPEEIVEAWQEKFESELKPWFIVEDANVKAKRAKLEANIASLLGKFVFTDDDMNNSLKVAKDAAKICKILQPTTPKKISFDTLELVLLLCARHHQVCKGPGGGGGWCDA